MRTFPNRSVGETEGRLYTEPTRELCLMSAVGMNYNAYRKTITIIEAKMKEFESIIAESVCSRLEDSLSLFFEGQV